MALLTADERVAFTLRHYEGRSIDEIGRTLGVQKSAAKHAVFRAVRKLREALRAATERNMNHCSDDDLVLYYYGEDDGPAGARGGMSRLRVALSRVDSPCCRRSTPVDVPARGDQYGLEVWQRIRHRLPASGAVVAGPVELAVGRRRDRGAVLLITVGFTAGRFWPLIVPADGRRAARPASDDDAGASARAVAHGRRSPRPNRSRADRRRQCAWRHGHFRRAGLGQRPRGGQPAVSAGGARNERDVARRGARRARTHAPRNRPSAVDGHARRTSRRSAAASILPRCCSRSA